MSTQTRTNTYAAVCDECGGPVAAGAGLLWWQAGPDDGGDVVGRTPAGWRVSHRTDTECAAYRAAQRQARAATQAAVEERYARWVRCAVPLRTVAAIDERDSYGEPCGQRIISDTDVSYTLVTLPYPLQPAVYRHRPGGGYEYLGAWRRYTCSAVGTRTDHAVTYPDALEGWVEIGGIPYCPEHTAQAVAQGARPLTLR